MSYSVDYSGEHPEQTNIVSGEYPPQAIRYIEVPRRGIAIPSIVKTFTTFLLGGAALFSLETMGPVQFRPSTIMGTYDSRVEEQVKAAEMRVQGRYEAWAVQVKANAEQNVEQYKAKTNGLITAYNGTMDRAKTYAQLTGQLQSQLAQGQLNRTSGEQSGEVGLISLGRMIGVIANGFDPGAGDGLMNWAEVSSDRLRDELDDAVINGRRVSIEGWDTGLPSSAELQRQLDSIQPIKIPPMPSLGPDHSSDR